MGTGIIVGPPIWDPMVFRMNTWGNWGCWVKKLAGKGICD